MNFVPYLGSATLLVFAAGIAAVTHLSLDAEGPLFERGCGIKLLLQLLACAVSFIAGLQL